MSTRREFLLKSMSLLGASSTLALASKLSFDPKEDIEIAKPIIEDKEGVEVLAQCGTSYSCSGGGGDCGTSYNCSGGGGQCGTSYNCGGG